jgi:chloramphenicol O-acetyltransferase type A
MHRMSDILDIATWPRREAFAHFKNFEQPFFNVCTRVDVAPLKAAVRDAVQAGGHGGLALAYHFIALRLVNLQQPFRLRLRGDQVLVLPEVHGSATVLRDDESFGFTDLLHNASFASFARQAAAAMAATRARAVGFNTSADDQALVYFTTLPWVHFTSFAHARRRNPNDSIPRFAFGRIDADGQGQGARQWLPLSVEVHHALMDGVHVGRFVQAFEAALAEPRQWLAS